MDKKKILASDVIGAAAADAVSMVAASCGIALGVPSNLAGSVVASWMRRRFENGRDILLDELRSGNKSPTAAATEDDLIATLFHYSRAVRDGTARTNLRIMAKIIAGKAQSGDLYASEYRRLADGLASLSREQTILIATLYKIRREWPPGEKPWPNQVWERAVAELVPTIYKSAEHMRADGWKAMSSGYLVDSEDIDSAGKPDLTPLVDELMRVADVEAAIRRETE